MRQVMFGAVLYACSWWALGQTAPAPVLVRFDSAMQQALANRPELKIEREKIAGARGRVAELEGAFMPTVTLSSTGQKVHRFDTFSGTTASATFAGQPVSVNVAASSPRYQTNLGIELNYNLYKGGADRAGINEALMSERAAMAQYSLAARKILIEVVDVCSALMKSALAYRQAMRALELAELETVLVRGRLDSGSVPTIEIREANVKHQTRLIELKNAKRTLREAHRKYCSVTASDCAQNEAEPSVPNFSTEMPDIKQLYAQFGLAVDAELDKAKADKDASGFRMEQTRAEYKPMIDLFARYSGIGRSDSGFGDARSSFGRELSLVGIQLSWKLFDGFRTDNRVKQEVATSEQLRLKQLLVQRDIDDARSAAQEDIQVLEEQAALEKMKLDLSQDQEKIANKRFQLKMISKLDHARSSYAVAEAVFRFDTLLVDLDASKIRFALQ